MIQNGNAYEEGLSPFWEQIKTYWASGGPAAREALRPLTSAEVTRFQYTDGVHDPARSTRRPGFTIRRCSTGQERRESSSTCSTTIAPTSRSTRASRGSSGAPATDADRLGRERHHLPAAGARAFLRDLPEAELHLLDSGHFALEDKGDEIVALMRDFLGRHLPAR